MKTIREILAESAETYFDTDSVDAWIEKIKNGIKVPYITVKNSTLGGFPTIMITVGLDAKETWINNIFENSRYGRLTLDPNGTLEMFRASWKTGKKMRKTKVKTPEDVVNKINAWIEKVPALGTIK